MHLTDRQLDRFFELLDGLIVFANERLHLVDGLSVPIVGDEAEMKAAYVCDNMWRHIEVLDEYLHLNPRKLRPADLEVIAGWRDALVGRFTLVRFERGRAILMNEAGLFAVAGLDDDPQKRMPVCPDMVIATLLPFEGIIISDGLMYGDGIPFDEAESRQLAEDLEQHAAEGVAWTAGEFAVRARAYNEKLREDAFDELMTSIEIEARQAREGERLPAGFHRGELAGLSGDERKARVDERMREMDERMGGLVQKRIAAYAVKGEPSEDLAACLTRCLRKDELLDLCRALDVSGYSGKAKKVLAGMLVEPLADAADALRQDLLVCSPESFDLFCRVMKAGGVLRQEIASLPPIRYPYPLPPYLFQFHDGEDLVSVVPTALRGVLAASDLEAIAYDRDREDAVVNCAETMAEYYGLLSLREAYDLYCDAVVNAYPIEDFVALLMREDSFDDLGFVLQEWHDDSYLMHYTVSDGHLEELVMNQSEDVIRERMSALLAEGFSGPAMSDLKGVVRQRMDEGMRELDRYREHVLEVRARTPRRPLVAGAADGTAYDAFFTLPAVVQLRDFYDAHVPDGEDDYTFADRAVDGLVMHAIEVGNVDAYLDTLEDGGWFKCAEDETLLPRLVENAYGALPSWDFNGWSPQEVLEKMSGRKVFYNVRGELLHPGPDESCPCGSGKLYRDCHGA